MRDSYGDVVMVLSAQRLLVTAPERIAILGWGSLLWDARPAFDNLHHQWWEDGPVLKIEFSRISRTRSGALTLVLDPINGAANRVSYCLSKRSNLSQAVEDLKLQESTIPKNIGFVDTNGAKCSRDQESMDSITTWASAKRLAGVVWTDLPSNFREITGELFFPERALAYLNTLDDEAAKVALEYIHRAPASIQTPLREALGMQEQTE